MTAGHQIVDRHGAIATAAVQDPHDRALAKAGDIGLCLVFWNNLWARAQVWRDFERLSDMIRLRGRQKFYAVRDVQQMLRWHYALSDPTLDPLLTDSRFSGEMARLYNAVSGTGFYKVRGRK